MDNKRNITYIIQLSLVLVFAMVFVAGGTFAYWQWASAVDKEVVFNTVSGYEEYVVYDPGESHFVGDFKKTDSFCQSISTTVSTYKIRNDIDFTLTLNMDINYIDSSISASNNVYWVVTAGNSNISCSVGVNGLSDSSVISYGTFTGKTAPSSFTLTEPINISGSIREYTVWIWIGNDTGLAVGETVDTHIWAQIDMLDRKGEVDYSGEAIAIYSTTDNSLRFYREEDVSSITIGSEYEGRVVSNLYTNFISEVYEYGVTAPPWYDVSDVVVKIVFEEPIKAVETESWFCNFQNAAVVDVTNLDVSDVTTMAYMFYSAGAGDAVVDSFQILGLNTWDTSNVTNMTGVFTGCGSKTASWSIGDIKMWDVSKVVSTEGMFASTGYNADVFILDFTGWNISSLKNANFMFGYSGYYAGTVALLGLETWDTSNVTSMDGMFASLGIYADNVTRLDLSGWRVCKISTRPSSFGNNNIIEPNWGMTCT